MINLQPNYLLILKNILNHSLPNCEVRVFGSRVNGGASKFSDIDIALVAPSMLPLESIEDIKDALANSDIPYCVDILDWNAISLDFRKIIEKRYYVL